MPTRASLASDAYAGGALRVRMPAPRIDLDPDGPTVSVVIPTLNEARNLPWLARRMPEGVKEIIVVDGRSTDDTVSVARLLWEDVRIVRQTRSGKGNALACGFAAATSDIIVALDADGSMDPGEIPYFVNALLAGADYAKGSRFADGGGSSDITRFRSLGNAVLNRLTGYVHKTCYTDLCYGYNAFWRYVLPVLNLDLSSEEDPVAEAGGDVHCEQRWGDGFEVETLLNIRVHLAGLRVTEVPSFETPRIHGRSNLRAFADGYRVLQTIARESHALRRGVRLPRETVQSMLGPRPRARRAPATQLFDAPAAPAYPDEPVIDLVAYERARVPQQGPVNQRA